MITNTHGLRDHWLVDNDFIDEMREFFSSLLLSLIVSSSCVFGIADF